jgi:lysophospholipase L1-like esterase
MNLLVSLFGSGYAFFLGIGLILASLVVFTVSRRRWLRIIASPLSLVGCILIALSATPLPYWISAGLGFVTILWLVAERVQRGWLRARRGLLRATVAIVWIAAAAFEIPYQMAPTLPTGGHPPLFIIGDSVAAGLDDRDKATWPTLLRSRQIEVTDLSRVGATAASAVRQAVKLPADGGIVLMEIGGNDLFGSTSAEQFERDLDRLLGRVCTPGRIVLMFELPLPPFCNQYGRAQRRLAAQYGVRLIPKRIFMGVLAGSETTLDSVHLSPEGHQRMAEAVWQVIGPAYR